MQPLYPPKFCISTVSDFLLGVTVVPRQLEDDGKNVFFWGGGGVHKVHCDQYENVE